MARSRIESYLYALVVLACLGTVPVIFYQGQGVNSLLLRLWWAIVTTTTVGYGDIAPETGTGRLIAVVLMLAGTALIATVAASVSAYFIGVERTEEYEDIKDRLDRIERILNPDE